MVGVTDAPARRHAALSVEIAQTVVARKIGVVLSRVEDTVPVTVLYAVFDPAIVGIGVHHRGLRGTQIAIRDAGRAIGSRAFTAAVEAALGTVVQAIAVRVGVQ
jgi:hypothetical protein